METQAPIPPGARRRLIAAGGCGLLLAAACLATIALPIALSLRKGPEAVERAVRASFPDFCVEYRDRLVVEPSLTHGFAAWDVACDLGFLGSRAPGMTVNVMTCEYTLPARRPADWLEWPPGWLLDRRPMPVCP